MYDAIVVGARCAGSPTAMLLARKGYRVLLLDRDAFPSDHMSTHWIHQPGVARLELRADLVEEEPIVRLGQRIEPRALIVVDHHASRQRAQIGAIARGDHRTEMVVADGDRVLALDTLVLLAVAPGSAARQQRGGERQGGEGPRHGGG